MLSPNIGYDMPLFFIDTDDGCTRIVDEDGHELADAQAAHALATRALSDMAQDGLGESDRREFSTQVRAADGSTVYSAALTLIGEWWIAPPAL